MLKSESESIEIVNPNPNLSVGSVTLHDFGSVPVHCAGVLIHLKLGCAGLAKKKNFASKRNEIRFVMFSHAQAKTKDEDFRFVSLQFFRFVSIPQLSFCIISASK
jgi:hypothetical protein